MHESAIVFDWGRTLYDPSKENLFPNTFEVLEFVKGRGYGVGLVSVALTIDIAERIQDLKNFNVLNLFDEVEILPRSREPKDFSVVLEKLRVLPRRAIIVGDNLKRDIAPANNIHAVSVWTKERLLGDFQPEDPSQEPRATIYQIGELRELIPFIENGLV